MGDIFKYVFVGDVLHCEYGGLWCPHITVVVDGGGETVVIVLSSLGFIEIVVGENWVIVVD